MFSAAYPSVILRSISYNRQEGRLSYRLLALVSAFIYGAVTSQIPSEHFKDFPNYLRYAEHSWSRLLGLLDQGVLVALSNEPIWLLINSILGAFLDPEVVVRSIIFLSSSTVAWFVLNSHPRYFFVLVAFLLLPWVVKNHIMQIRQGAGIALFLLAWFSSGRAYRWGLMGLTPFVHASFFFILPLVWAAKIMTECRLGPGIRVLGFVAVGVGVGGAGVLLASLLGARQSYEFAVGDVSGVGFFLWASVLAILLLEGPRFLRVYAFETGLVVFYLSVYWVFELSGRIFESGLLLVLLAGLSLTGWRRMAFMSLILTTGSLVWLMRLAQPGMGFVVV